MFAPIKLEWNGKQHTIAPNRVLPAIAEVEEVFTLDELQRFSKRGTAPVAKLAMAYGKLLRFAGAVVDDDEVYAGMFVDNNGQTAANATSSLLALMLPPPGMINADAGKSAAGKPGKAKGNSSSANSTS